MIEFQVNGQTVTSESEADTPLLWVIRDELKLKGTKFGCGIAMCGACTVHIDGVATRSCITQVGTVAGKSITTIEGLDSDEGKALAAGPGSMSRCRSAATASPARSCRPAGTTCQHAQPDRRTDHRRR